MTKRKILLLAMALCMVAILAVGGTLAYFTAEDSADNVFTMGYVDIELEETFEQSWPGHQQGRVCEEHRQQPCLRARAHRHPRNHGRWRS